MKKLMNYIGILLLVWTVCSCTDEQVISNVGTELRVTGKIDTPSSSRTSYAVGEEAVTVSWAAGDRIGLFSESQPAAMAYQAASAGKQVDFMPETTRLKPEDGTEVYAFYPYNYYTDITYPHAPLPYLSGQNYNGGLPDPNTDFMYAKGEIKEGRLSFDFAHLFAFLKVNVRTELLQDAQGLLIHSNEPISFTGIGGDMPYYDMEGDSLVAEKFDYLWYSIPQEALNTQEVVTCFITVLPTSEQNTVSFFIWDENGYSDKGLIEKKAPEGGFQAGHVYDLSVDENEFDKIVQQEREALIAFYEATGGDNWTDNTNWCSDKPLSEWYGVGFWDGHVRSIHMPDNNLTGPIPEEFGNLIALEDLYVVSNNLTSIPESIGNLTSLTSINFFANNLSGDIPESIGNLTSLTSLDLGANNLTGDIPESIGNLTSLTFLALSENELAGNIPESIGNLTSLTELYLYDNELTGNIPENIGNLVSLTILNIGTNDLTGNLPASIANLNALEYIDLCGNRLSGMIPEAITTCDWWNRLGYNEVIYQQEGYKLTFSMYESSDYSMDGTVITLQEHTVGKGLKVVIMGEAYSDRLIADGTYRRDAEIAMEAFFSEEPYTSFRNYFDVYVVNVVSRNEVIGQNTAFQVSYEWGRNTFLTDPAIAVDYVSRIAETNYSAANVTSIVLINSEANFRSNSWSFSDGFSVGFCLADDDLKQLVHHEVCGHGFGRLADEYVEFEGFYATPYVIVREHGLNESMNVDVTDNPDEVIWSYFLTDMRYEKEKIGIYEGALYYPKGAYRATENSIMRYNTGGFNAPSRQSIYRRIMEESGGVYSFEAFLEYDEINRRRIEMEGASRAGAVEKGPVGLPPVRFDYPSSEAKTRWKQTGTINVPLR